MAAPIQTTLRERIAALQHKGVLMEEQGPIQQRGTSPIPSSPPRSKTPTGPPKPSGGAFRAKIAQFEEKGGTPVPRGTFGLWQPAQTTKRNNELYGNRIPSAGQVRGPETSRSPLFLDPASRRTRSVSASDALFATRQQNEEDGDDSQLIESQRDRSQDSDLIASLHIDDLPSPSFTPSSKPSTPLKTLAPVFDVIPPTPQPEKGWTAEPNTIPPDSPIVTNEQDEPPVFLASPVDGDNAPSLDMKVAEQPSGSDAVDSPTDSELVGPSLIIESPAETDSVSSSPSVTSEPSGEFLVDSQPALETESHPGPTEEPALPSPPLVTPITPKSQNTELSMSTDSASEVTTPVLSQTPEAPTSETPELELSSNPAVEGQDIIKQSSNSPVTPKFHEQESSTAIDAPSVISEESPLDEDEAAFKARLKKAGLPAALNTEVAVNKSDVLLAAADSPTSTPISRPISIISNAISEVSSDCTTSRVTPILESFPTVPIHVPTSYLPQRASTISGIRSPVRDRNSTSSTKSSVPSLSFSASSSSACSPTSTSLNPPPQQPLAQAVPRPGAGIQRSKSQSRPKSYVPAWYDSDSDDGEAGWANVVTVTRTYY